MELLVAGAAGVDAGKTTFAAGLVAHTGAVGFKPRAGNDYWYHHDDVLEALDGGRLYGKDARTLAETSPGTLDPEDVNPVHRLWRPSTGPDTGLIGQSDREFLVDRAGNRYVLNNTVALPDRVSEALPLESAIRVDSLADLNAAMEQHHLPALTDLAGDVADTGHAVVESYSDIARPLQNMSPDAVAVVEPRRVRIYDGHRYMRACDVATRSPQEGTLEERVGDVTDLVEPVATAALPPLSSAQRGDPDTSAANYDGAYERLLAVAE